LAVPLIHNGTAVGGILARRQQARPFTDKQIDLLQNFAAQAAIAIENARLLNELRQRTADLSESLEQQTATSEVLGVIGTSPGDLEPVFQTMLQNATRICQAKFGRLFLCVDDGFQSVAQNMPPALTELWPRNRIVHPGPTSSLVRSTATREVVQIGDLMTDPGYALRDPLRVSLIEKGGIRSVLSVPMLKENAVIGAFNLYRETIGSFDEKHVDLVKNFAAQAVIAIENARLLMNYGSLWSSRRRHRRCSASSVRRPTTWSRFSRRFWTTLRVSARRNLAFYAAMTVICFSMLQFGMRQNLYWNLSGSGDPFRQYLEHRWITS
jgi:GAF domain-containing protein